MATVLALGALTACEVPAPRYRFGENITGLTFHVFDPTEGVHPSKAVLQDPNNPFASTSIGEDSASDPGALKWELLSSGGDAAAFYAWATLLARGPYGTLQFYSAKKLSDLYRSGQVEPSEAETVRDMALRGFQVVLDTYPEEVTYDATGTTSYRLATMAYHGILDLDGEPAGGWVLVTTPNGQEEAVKGGNNP